MHKDLFQKLEKSLQQAIKSEREGCEKETVEEREVDGKKVEVKRINEDSLE